MTTGANCTEGGCSLEGWCSAPPVWWGGWGDYGRERGTSQLREDARKLDKRKREKLLQR